MLEGAPTIFINGKLVRDCSPEGSRKVIDKELPNARGVTDRPYGAIPGSANGASADQLTGKAVDCLLSIEDINQKEKNMSYSASDIIRSDSFVEVGYGVDCPNGKVFDVKSKQCVSVGKKKLT